MGREAIRNPFDLARAAVRIVRATAGAPQQGALALPDFIIVGAQKAGTSSLKANLRQHPEVFVAGKEVHFFDGKWDKGIDWYQAQFAKGIGKLCGEKTPRYMTKRLYMERIHQVVPEAKIVVLLREPAARLFSQINHQIQRGKLPEPTVVDVDYLQKHILDDPQASEEFVARGFYADQIEGNIYSLFPRDRVFIRHTDGWAATLDPQKLRSADGNPNIMAGRERGEFTRRLLHDLERFLGVKPWEPKEYRVTHVRSYKADITSDARARAAELYREANERLFELLGYEIPEWSAPRTLG
jgi:hypothetical protein